MGKPKKIKIVPSYERSCLGKQTFATMQAAREACKPPSFKPGTRKKPVTKGRMEPYKCRYCDGYHYGHPIRRKITIYTDKHTEGVSGRTV